MDGDGRMYGDPSSNSSPSEITGADPWRSLSAAELRANTIVFPAQKQIKLAEYIHSMEEAGFDAKDIMCIQVSTDGKCRVTLEKATVAQGIASRGFRIGEENISPKFYANQSNGNLQLHIHDVPVWVPDCAVVGALAQYGNVQGSVRHGKLKVREGVFVASGVRFATFKPKPGITNIPSYVKSCDGKTVFRVHHAGQQRTCRICNSTQHLAAGCPRVRIDPPTTHPNLETGSTVSADDRDPADTRASYSRAVSSHSHANKLSPSQPPCSSNNTASLNLPVCTTSVDGELSGTDGSRSDDPVNTFTEDDYESAESATAHGTRIAHADAPQQHSLTKPEPVTDKHDKQHIPDAQPTTDEERTTRVLSHVSLSNLPPTPFTAPSTQNMKPTPSTDATTTCTPSRVPAEFSDADTTPFTVYHRKRRSRGSNANSPETTVTPDRLQSQSKKVKRKTKKSPRASPQQ